MLAPTSLVMYPDGTYRGVTGRWRP